MTERRIELINARKYLKKLRADLPTLSQVHALRPGQWVRLIPHQDWPKWVEITEVNGTGHFLGKEDWASYQIPFTAKHVAEIQQDFQLIDLTKEDGYDVHPAAHALEIGDRVNVGCVGKDWCKREWFWVKVTDVTDGCYQGKISNLLVTRHYPSACDIITFAPNHVLLVQTAAEAEEESRKRREQWEKEIAPEMQKEFEELRNAMEQSNDTHGIPGPEKLTRSE